MAYVKEHPPSEVYHLTKKENLNSILEDGMIRRFSDMECWFCVDLQKMKAYMEQTVMCEGKPYYDVTGQLCRYPKFVPEDYVLLKLIPCRQEDNWYRWEQEIPAGSPAALVRAAREFSALKIGYRGDLAFHNAEVIDVPQFLVEGVTQGEPVQTNTELRDILSQRIEDEMADYMRRLDLRTRDELIQTADEIDAMMTCDCELRLLRECLPREELVFLLEQDRPLEQMSKAWMAHRNVDVGETFQSLLTGLYAEQQHDMAQPQAVASQSAIEVGVVSQLLHHMSRVFRGNMPVIPPALRIDSKRRRRLQEKRMAMGHKRDDHEDEQLHHVNDNAMR